ncbi:hypothetical protein VPNG_08711 [Cytospora leucostoma]|uniref:Uncharacterized protein n=1 Tax=Cytospora leucostoma TaxID=1230097 RepID=A0A423W2H3_9PEZI|nr:hypothetical protein VPNG_08711 [Cytospora leucostoma]
MDMDACVTKEEKEKGPKAPLRPCTMLLESCGRGGIGTWNAINNDVSAECPAPQWRYPISPAAEPPRIKADVTPSRSVNFAYSLARNLKDASRSYILASGRLSAPYQVCARLQAEHRRRK